MGGDCLATSGVAVKVALFRVSLSGVQSHQEAVARGLEYPDLQLAEFFTKGFPPPTGNTTNSIILCQLEGESVTLFYKMMLFFIYHYLKKM